MYCLCLEVSLIVEGEGVRSRSVPFRRRTSLRTEGRLREVVGVSELPPATLSSRAKLRAGERGSTVSRFRGFRLVSFLVYSGVSVRYVICGRTRDS